MTINTDHVMAICTVITLLGGVVAFMLAAKDKAQQGELERLRDLITSKDESAKKDLCQRDREMDRLDANMKAAWAIVDRLKEDRSQYWTREEHDKWRVEVKQELKDDIHAMGERLSEKLGEVSEKFGDKIADIMKRCADCRK